MRNDGRVRVICIAGSYVTRWVKLSRERMRTHAWRVTEGVQLTADEVEELRLSPWGVGAPADGGPKAA